MRGMARPLVTGLPWRLLQLPKGLHMMTFTLDNPTGKTPARALLGMLRMTLQRRHSVVCFAGHDILTARHARTRKWAVEVELYEDGSGLEVAFWGRWLVFGVAAKRVPWAVPHL